MVAACGAVRGRWGEVVLLAGVGAWVEGLVEGYGGCGGGV